jgi:hypothetical protein
MAHGFPVARTFMAVGVVLGVGYGAATAEDARVVYLPMSFSTEARVIRTTACLQVTERAYPQTAWWEGTSSHAAGADRAFTAVIAAIKHKDRAALLKATDPEQGKDTKRFDTQAGAFFQQFEVVELIAVPRAYEFDGLAVFFGKLRAKSQTIYAPFAFAYEGGDGSFGFLPSRTRKLTFELVTDWFMPSDGPPPTDNPPYCADADVKRATHRVSFASASGSTEGVWRPSYLLLTGAPLDAPGSLARLATEVKSTIDQMKTALRGNQIGDLVKHMTPEGGNRVSAWFASADQTERDRYKASITEEQPFFVFDQSPLVVVYTKSAAGVVHVMYFTFDAAHRLVWTNSAHITVGDRVFKDGPLFNAASAKTPFSSLAIK